MTTTPGQPADALAKALESQEHFVESLCMDFRRDIPGGLAAQCDAVLKGIRDTLVAYRSQFTAPSGQGREAQDAARWRYWRKERETNVVVSIFGNGCVNKTIEQAEAEIDAALASQPSTDSQNPDLGAELGDTAQLPTLSAVSGQSVGPSQGARAFDATPDAGNRQQSSQPSTEPQCKAPPGECAHNRACMYHCGRMQPPSTAPANKEKS